MLERKNLNTLAHGETYWEEYWSLYIQSTSNALSLSLFPVAPTMEHRASVKRFVSLQFLNPRTVSRSPWMGDQPVARPLLTQTCMPWVGFVWLWIVLSPEIKCHTPHLQSGFLLGLFFDPEDEGNMLLPNIGWLWTDYMAYPRR
jgi:hypothetical protein